MEKNPTASSLTLEILDGRYAACRLDSAQAVPVWAWRGPLARAGISILALATFDTDYLLVREPDLGRAVAALRAAGHHVGFGSWVSGFGRRRVVPPAPKPNT